MKELLVIQPLYPAQRGMASGLLSAQRLCARPKITIATMLSLVAHSLKLPEARLRALHPRAPGHSLGLGWESALPPG